MQLKAENIEFAYNQGKTILDGVDFEVKSGEIVGLTAPSGFGKSTLGKVLAGYITPNSGKVTIDGVELPNKGFNPVQLIFQHPEKSVNPKWKMRKILEESWTPPKEMVDAMGIKEGWMSRWPSELSGGELQRFCVLRALTPNTRFLIADEMTTMLDVITQAQIWRVVIDYARKNNVGLVVISHEKDLVSRICDRVVYMDAGSMPDENCLQIAI